MARQPRQQRIDVYGGFTPTGVDRTAGDKMRALAGLGQQMRESTLAIGKPMVEAERVKQAEIASAETGTIDPETGELRGPAEEVAAYKFGAAQANAVMRNTYEANVSVEMNNIVDSAATEFPDDIVGYQNKVQSQMQGLIGAMPEEYRGQAQNLYARLDNPTSTKIADNERKKNLAIANTEVRQAATVAEKGLSNAAFAGDVASTADFATEYAVSLQRLVDQGDMTTDRQAELLAAQDERIIVQGKLGEVDRAIRAEGRTPEQQIEDGRAIVEALRENPDADLSAEKNQELLNKLEANVNSLEREYLSEATTLTAEENNIKADFKQEVGLGLLTDEELTAKAYNLQEKGILTADERASFVVNINKRSEAQIKTMKSNATVARKIGGDSAVGDQPVDQKAVNTYYDDVLSNNLSTDNLDLRSAQQSEVVARTGYLASTNKTEIRNALNSQDPAQIEYAAETIERMQKIPGVGESLFTDKEVAFASQVTASSQYMPMDEAIKQANAIVRPGPQQEATLNVRKAEIKDKKNSDTFADAYPDEIDDAFEGIFEDISDELGRDLLISDYGNLVESYYLAGITDIDAAKAKAMSLVQANWTKGEFGLMKYSPESFYALPVSGDTSYIRTQLQEELDAGGLSISSGDVFLVSDDETARTASTNQPSYRVMYRDNDGTLRTVSFIDEQGNENSRFIPDVQAGKTQQESNIKAAAEAGMTPYGKTSSKSYTTLSESQQDRMRRVLQSSTNPFALIGKGIDAAASLPGKVTPKNIKLLLDQTGIEFAAGEIGDAYQFVKDSVQEASDNYVASLRKNKGK